MSGRKKLAAGALCVAAAGAVGGAVAAQSGEEGDLASAPEDTETDLVDPVDDALQACADSWNGDNPNKASVASLATVAQAENPTSYVHVGFSSVFPDRCLITVANPSTMYAQQYLQGGGAEWSGRGFGGCESPGRGAGAFEDGSGFKYLIRRPRGHALQTGDREDLESSPSLPREPRLGGLDLILSRQLQIT